MFKCSANTFFFTNPNAPTGKGFPVETVEKIADGFGGMVLVDEAYAPFADYSAATLVKKYPNLIVTGTMSKGWGLAGMRLGWAIANPEVIEILDRVRDSYNLDRLAQAAGIAALSDEEYHAKYVQEIKNTRRITEHFLDSIGWKHKKLFKFHPLTPNKNGAECPEIAAEFAAFLRSKNSSQIFASDPA
ncbi:MAG: aminotransferase class I/II-fold pyridoxal phosphate-dependent enzyme [Bacilli bacterium]